MTPEEDTRNLVDELKGLSNEEVFERLSKKRNNLEVAIENVGHDFNIGTVVRNANAFNVVRVCIVGKKKYNRRGAMCTDKYLEICHFGTTEEFLADQRRRGRRMIAIENNVPGAKALSGIGGSQGAGDDCGDGGFRGGGMQFRIGDTLVFGSESDGLSEEMLAGVDEIRYIESFGSTRSVNVGVASGIAMYEWVRQCVREEESVQ